MDPYALAQTKQRRAANIARQEVLRKERKEALGDPVRGVPTPFLESFDNVGGSAVLHDTTSTSSPQDGVQIKSADDIILNHFLNPSELQQAINRSHYLAEPVVSSIGIKDPVEQQRLQREHQDGHERATAALSRIVSLANASQKDKTRANIRRCIDTFGRHNTDSVLRPRAPTSLEMDGSVKLPEKTPRAGPDTGSSEVQIAILTAKIRVLANQLEMKGAQKDKINKRNLRVLVHKRQKLLAYLRRKERGSDRWQNLVETLGLSDGTWKGEISL